MEDIEQRLEAMEERLSKIEEMVAEQGKRISKLADSALIDNPETTPDSEDDG
ncbi:MAG TPA: hypothetical protein VKM55_08555 [Candidatus Lokiarchaeia archaeon]|nr:hypothetical protein [Candidatus Lokiarchaeia archaeon]